MFELGLVFCVDIRMTGEPKPEPPFLSTTQIAREARVTARAILARAERLGVKPIGMFGRTKLWTVEAAERLRKGR